MIKTLRKLVMPVVMAICILLSGPMSLQCTAVAGENSSFTDIASSPYRDAIAELHDLGITAGVGGGRFNPGGIVTKAEAATFIKKAFNLADINPMVYAPDPDLQKKVIYTSSLESINEAFTVPSASDIVNYWASPFIEGILNARIDSVTDNSYHPNAQISEKDFCTMLAKAIYGPDKKIDHLQTAVKDGFIPESSAKSTGLLSREKAASLITGVVGGDRFKIVTIFATSDIHGNLIPYKPSGSNVSIGSLAKMSKIINDWRAKQPNLLLLDCGDSPYNTNIANFFEGASTVEVMSKMGYDATALGNHDFDYSFDILKKNALSASYPFLSANTYMKDGSYPSFLKPYIIKDVDGLKIGIVGLTDDTSKIYTHYTNTKDIDFHDQFAVASKVIPEVDAQSDITVVLSHLHNNNPVLPTKVSGIDVEIGGGNDIVGPPTLIGDTWLINPGKHAEALNQININVYDNKFIGLNFSQIFMSENLPDDPAIAAITDKYQAQLDIKMSSVIGKTDVNLDGERATVRLKESNLGNLIADSLRTYMDADIAFQNGGGIRASKAPGDLTQADIYAMLPFDNKVMMLEATGQTVWEVLENAVSNYPAADGRFLQVSGISYTFDASKEKGSRIVSIKINGADLDKSKKYKIVVNDFMAGGGDGNTMINVKGENPVDNVKILAETNYFLRDVFTQYIAEHSPVTPKVEGRIVILNAPAQ